MEIRYILPKDNLYEISNIYEQSWKYTYKDIIPESYLNSIPSGTWADNINKNGTKMESMDLFFMGNIKAKIIRRTICQN